MRKVALALVVFAFSAMPAVAAELPSALVQPYLKAQVLLSTDKIDGLADAAKAVETAAATLGKDGEAMVASAKKMGAAKKIDEARAAFGALSVALVGYADKTKATLPKDLHVAYCPMEDKPWMQAGKEIKNPYYGASMLECGSIKK
ncbi:MAG: hypothetical protein ACRD2N_09030 [Vicinamibacterales bacterium]